jgi:predicted SnoaL-like aldol condensation-catalyzing enzyme
MNQTREARNKALVLEAFETLFNKRDYATAERYCSPSYIQHSAHIEPGREGLLNLIKSAPPALKYEAGVIMAEGEFVIVHGRFSGNGRPVNWIAADILRIADGVCNCSCCRIRDTYRCWKPRNRWHKRSANLFPHFDANQRESPRWGAV